MEVILFKRGRQVPMTQTVEDMGRDEGKLPTPSA